jgi:hypothetical protein
MSAGSGLDRLAANAARFADEWPRDGADLIRTRMDAALKADTGGDGRFSHARMGAGAVDVSASSGGAQVSAGGSSGVWTWLEHGTRGHTSNANPRSALRTPYGPKARVKVGGMAAKRTWTRNVAPAIAAATADAKARLGRLVG